ncbi:RDD family protein [Methanobrevibacter arboriphilus]|nr:RDD family protein [Methanobrevibacter arboriphilus]
MIILAPIIGLAYFILLEKKLGTTVGKHLLFLKVLSTDSYNYNNKISYKQSVIRNLSKIYWIPIIFDILIGRFTGSSNERILGRLSHSEVVLEDMQYSNKVSLNPELSEDND